MMKRMLDKGTIVISLRRKLTLKRMIFSFIVYARYHLGTLVVLAKSIGSIQQIFSLIILFMEKERRRLLII